MSTELTVSRIQGDPKFHQLVRQRDGLAWALSAIVCAIYFGFIMLIAFADDFLTQPVAAGSVIPVGLPLGVGVIIASIVLTGVYVYRANTTFDRLIHDIIQDASK